MLYKTLTIIALMSTLLISGCASFPKEEIANIKNMPNVSKYKNKPSIYLDFEFYSGKPGDPTAIEARSAEDKLRSDVKKIVENTKLFSSITLDEFKKESTDYTVRLRFYNHGDTGAAAISGIITGLTFGIIPGMATDNYTLLADITDRNNNVIVNTKNKDSIETWVGIWFIPVMGNTPEKAIIATFENQIRSALKTMIMKGKLKYSFNIYPFAPYSKTNTKNI